MKALRGFSLIELIVGMLILGILLALAMPGFSNWLHNARVRTTAESVQNGLQLARAEAVRRNTPVLFSLVTTTDAGCARDPAGPNWVISLDDPTGKCDEAPSDDADPRIIQSRSAAEGGAAVTIDSDQSSFLFNSLGRLTTPAGNVNFLITREEDCLEKAGPVRCLRVMVSIGGQIRMCDPDPALPAGHTQACPP